MSEPTDAGALRERLGELGRRRRAGTLPGAVPAAAAAAAPKAASAPDAGDDPEIAPRRQSSRKRRVGAHEPRATGVEAFLPGGEWRHERHGNVYVHERMRSDVERRRTTWGRLPEPPAGELELSSLRHLGLARALFLDLETCGLSSSPVFLAGTMFWNGRTSCSGSISRGTTEIGRAHV